MSSFSNLTAQSAVIGSLNISNVSGTGIAQAVEAIGGVVNNKVITPSGLRAFAQNAPPIGVATAGPAAFSSIIASSIGGSVIASIADVAYGTPGKIVTASTLSSVLNALPPIGLKSANSARFSDLTATSITGGVIALDTDLLSYASNSRVITPATLRAAFSSPPAIGDSSPNAATFTTVSASTLTLGSPLPPASGGTGNTSFQRGDLLVSDGSLFFKVLQH